MSEKYNHIMRGIDRVQELDTLLKKAAIRFMFLITCVFFLFAAFFCYEGLYPYNYLVPLYFVAHIIFTMIPVRLDYSAIKLIIPLYIFLISIFLYPIVLFLWMIGQVTAFMWFFIFPVGTMVFFSAKTVIFWSIYILIEALSIFVFCEIIPYKVETDFSGVQLAVMNIMTISSCLVIISFFIYYINRTNLLKMEILKSKDNSKDKKETEENNERYEELYRNILNYFQNKKPYCNPDFTINQLADAMNTNITYISKAININECMNFNLFVNTYRINMVKHMLGDRYQDKYTIKYIYTSSGFKHQSTFNKVFKLIEGITPSEYIKKVNTQNQDTADIEPQPE